MFDATPTLQRTLAHPHRRTGTGKSVQPGEDDMGMFIDRMLFLQNRHYLTQAKNRILDVGAQNVYNIKRGKLCEFIVNQGFNIDDDTIKREIARLVYFSTPRQDERTTLLSELTDLVGVEYNSFDVCPGLKTDIVDLNFDLIADRHREYYDVVLNFGTSEHIFNQWNCFQIMHEALKVGGIMYFHLQVTGNLEHGYYFYTPKFFRDLAESNEYKIEELFLAEADFYKLGASDIDARGDDSELTPLPHSATRHPSDVFIPAYNANVVLRKTRSAPFRCCLEVSTAHANVDPFVAQNYSNGGRVPDVVGRLQEVRRELAAAHAEIAAIRQSTSWRVTGPLRAVGRLLARD